MRKPTRGEVRKAVIGSLYTHPVEEAIADAVMALFEDKPTPKWEGEFDKLFGNSHLLVPEGVNLFDGKCHDVKAPVKDFIREKLRELREDCHPDDYRAGPVKEKWGL